jgi:membrane associated rhomboid family serine protease
MAFLQSGHGREPFLKAPVSVLSLIGALVAAHVARMMMTTAAAEHVINEYALIPLRYSPDALDPGSVLDRAIPFVSYMFLHADLAHLGFNCLWLLAFGSVVARRFGTARFLLFFTVCGIAAAMVHLALNWESPGAVLGASGAISGLMGAGIRMMSMRRPDASASRPGLASIFSPQVVVFSVLWIVVNLVFGFIGLGVGGEVQPIAWQAHLGGYFAGVLLTGPFDGWAGKSDGDLPLAA